MYGFKANGAEQIPLSTEAPHFVSRSIFLKGHNSHSLSAEAGGRVKKDETLLRAKEAKKEGGS